MVLKESCTDTLEELPLGTRDQAPDKSDDLIEERRNDPRFAKQASSWVQPCFAIFAQSSSVESVVRPGPAAGWYPDIILFKKKYIYIII